ncbi:hypothetical protein DMB66_34355 [Actinoplanes sp. ATCC 53533]|uniref:hypothetical protein n=1 Tax=Actinoplanes sp. ATCC 53533 TaxID=1288362 RepID=UPI000F79C121|nr:hypothetical protein [Actinoplanes sp. ATCC 53533]RSM56489.1 hypothetical protein DMB66_34355 [Actinoplanes sp. ATCC 53533]
MTSVELRPPVIRALTWLLVATAAATAGVELLNFWYAPEQGFGLAVRTGWALLRTLAWLILIWHVRRSRAVSRPLGLILAVTTVFAVGRLVVPRDGAPPVAGLAGFGVLALLCAAVVVLLYRHPTVRGHLVRYPNKLVATRQGLEWREAAPRRPPVAAWVLTARVAAFTYSPLILVPAVISVGELGSSPEYILAVVFWIFIGIGASYAVLLTTFFLQRGKAWARQLMVWVSLGVLVIDLPLCYLLLGADGLIRDGAPLVAAALLACYAVWRAGRTAAATDSAAAAAAAPA